MQNAYLAYITHTSINVLCLRAPNREARIYWRGRHSRSTQNWSPVPGWHFNQAMSIHDLCPDPKPEVGRRGGCPTTLTVDSRR